MSIAIGDLVGEGFERTVSRNGLLFVAAFYVLSVAGSALSGGMGRAPGPAGMPPDPSPPAGISPVVLGLLGLVLGLVSLVATVGAIRTFVTGESEEIPTEHFTRNLGWVLVNLVVGGLVFGLAVGLGFLLLVIPGLFLLVSLFFWNYYVVVEGENFVDGFRRSWEATAGERLGLFALGVVVVLITLVVNVLFGLPSAVLPGAVGLLVSQVGSAFTNVFTVATAARTYVRLEDAESTGPAPAREAHAVE